MRLLAPSSSRARRMALETTLAAWILLSCMTCGANAAATFVVTNNCADSVWPGVLPDAGQPLLANGGFALLPGQSVPLQVPSGWAGRLWGRTGCSFDSNGVGSCYTADCGGKLQCGGAGATPPATLVEFTLRGTAGATQDFYDVSLVDGYNVAVAVTPMAATAGTCGSAGCDVDINSNCPTSLQVLDDSGQVVSCKSACLAFQSAQYCCDGAYANPTTCTATIYSEFFKAACPTAYSYAYDDATSTFTCTSSQYSITFCPSSASSTSSQKASNGNLPSSTGQGDTSILSTSTWNGSASLVGSLSLAIFLLVTTLGFLAMESLEVIV